MMLSVIICHYVPLCASMSLRGIICQYVIMWHYISCAIICHYMPLNVIMCNYMSLYAIMCHYVPLYASVCHYMQVCVIICKYVSLYVIICVIICQYVSLCAILRDFVPLCVIMCDSSATFPTLLAPHITGSHYLHYIRAIYLDPWTLCRSPVCVSSLRMFSTLNLQYE
jgi:hypothetical protein